MSESIADLYLLFTANVAQPLEAFTKLGAGGEAMATKIDAALKSIQASVAKLGTEMQAAAGRVSATGTEMAAANDRAALSFKAEADAARVAAAEVAAAQEGMAAKVTAATREMTAAEERWAAANKAAMNASKASVAENTAQMATWRAQTEAASAGVVAAQAKAAKAAEDVGRTSKLAAAETAAAGAISSKAFKGVSLAAAAVGFESVKMAGDFQQASERLVTSAGEDQKALEQMVRPELISMTGQLGVSAKQLAEDLYPINSAGIHAAGSLGVLRAAEQGAAAEGAHGKEVADALTSALHDYYGQTLTTAQATGNWSEVTTHANEIMSAFLGATSQGKTTFQELAGSMNNILPTASALGISLQDVLGVLASMTSHGISARQASENMNHAMQKLAGQGTTSMRTWALTVGTSMAEINKSLGEKGLAKTLEMIDQKIKQHMGPGAAQVILQLGDVVKGADQRVKDLTSQLAQGTMTYGEYKKAVKDATTQEKPFVEAVERLMENQQMLNGHLTSGEQVVSSYGAMWRNVTGDMTTAKVGIFTTGENAEYTNQSIKKIGESMKDGAALTEAWDHVQGNFNTQLKKAVEGAGGLAIAIGMKLLPILTPMVAKIAEFTHWISQNEGAATAAAVVIGVVLAGAFTTLALRGTLALLKLSTGWIADLAKMRAWAATKAGILKTSQAATVASAEAEVAAESASGLKRIAVAARNGASWLALKTANAVSWTLISTVESAKAVAVWAASGAKMVAQAAVDGAKWLAAWTAKFVAAAAAATVQAAATVAAWVAASAKMLVDAAAKGAVWLAGMVGRFVAVAAAAVVQAAITAGAWIAANLAMIVATGGIVLAIGLVIAAGVWLVTHWGLVKQKAGEVWGWIQQQLHTKIGMIVAVFAGPIGWGLLLIANWEKIKQKAGEVWDWVTQKFSSAGTWLVNAGKAILDGFLNGLKSAWEGVKSFIGGIGSWIAAHKGPIGTDAVLLNPHGQAILKGLQDGMVKQQTTVQQYLTSFPTQSILPAFASSPTLLVPAGRQVMTGWKQGFDQQAQVALQGAQQWATTTFPQAFYTAFQQGGAGGPSKLFHTMAQNLLVGFQQGYDQQQPTVINNVKAKCLELIQAANQVFQISGARSQVFYQMGANLMDSLAAAIRENGQKAVAAARQVAQQVAAASRSALRIRSPSGVFYDMGSFSIDGLVNAFADGKDRAVRAAVAVMDAVSSAGRRWHRWWDWDDDDDDRGGDRDGRSAPPWAAPALGSLYKDSAGQSLQVSNLTPIVTGVGVPTAPGAGFAPGAGAGAAGAGDAGGDTHWHFHCEGSILTADNLVRDMQEALQRKGMRNVSSGTNYAFH